MTTQSGAKVLVLLGSRNDWKAMKACGERLHSLGIPHDVHVASAHRTPGRVETLIREGEAVGVQVFIAAAGMAAHLAGAVAARTSRPVIGVPLVSEAFGALDATLSTVNMPPGVPVLTVSAGAAGAVNAAVAAAQILALSDPDLATRLAAERKAMAERIEQHDRDLQEERQYG